MDSNTILTGDSHTNMVRDYRIPLFTKLINYRRGPPIQIESGQRCPDSADHYILVTIPQSDISESARTTCQVQCRPCQVNTHWVVKRKYFYRYIAWSNRWWTFCFTCSLLGTLLWSIIFPVYEMVRFNNVSECGWFICLTSQNPPKEN